MIKRSTLQHDQYEIISQLTSENEYLKVLFKKFFFSQKSLDSMLASTRRSQNLDRLRSSSHHASTSKHHIPHHVRKVHHNRYHQAPYHHMQWKNNHVGISYRSITMTIARYEILNHQYDFIIFHDIQNAYRRFRHRITIQPKDFKAKWVLKSQLIRLKVI